MILNQKRPVPLALALGVLGGAALIVTEMIHSGPRVMLPYAGLVIASFVAIRVVRWPEFSRRFLAAFLAFMTATVVVVLYLVVFADGVHADKIPWWWYGVVLLIMGGIGGTLSAAVAYLADLGQRNA